MIDRVLPDVLVLLRSYQLEKLLVVIRQANNDLVE